ncbi:MAG: DUF1643 domain-containing protein [Cyanobacteria bacterium P01_E01_bin.42]
MFDIYQADREEKHRFLLGKNGKSILFVVGLNPSTANQEKSDVTASKVEKVALNNGYDGFVMSNLYPLRSTNPKNLPETGDRTLIKQNVKIISSLARSRVKPVFWAAWGGGIKTRSYLQESLLLLAHEVSTVNGSWVNYGLLRKDGHPRHPSRLSYSWTFQDFDILSYVKNLPSQDFSIL